MEPTTAKTSPTLVYRLAIVRQPADTAGCIPQGFVGSGRDAAGSSCEELTLFRRRIERFGRYQLAHCTGCAARYRTTSGAAAGAVGQPIPREPFEAAMEKGQLFKTRPCSIWTRPDKTLRYASRYPRCGHSAASAFCQPSSILAVPRFRLNT